MKSKKEIGFFNFGKNNRFLLNYYSFLKFSLNIKKFAKKQTITKPYVFSK
jgi:hypothetical protein